jgi:putative mycofactocin binding protein MftB
VDAISTDPATTDGAGPIDRHAMLSPGTTVRREPFGGLVYSFHTRRLRVVRSRPAIEVVIRIGAGESLEDASAWLVEAGYAADLDRARRFVNSTVERFLTLGVMAWTTS